MVPGKLRVAPLKEHLPDWQADYRAMSRVMFAGEPPAFDDVLLAIEEFQDGFNRQPPVSPK
jgi:hypothetical protein